MKAALLALVLGGCITIVQQPSDDAVTGDDDGSGGGSGGGGGGTGPSGCALETTAAPMGKLAAFELAADGTQWMLVAEGEEGVTTLWQRTSGAWSQRLFDEECRYGVLAVDAQSRANVACSVQSASVADFDLRVFVAGAQSTTSRLVFAAGNSEGPNGGRPSSMVIDGSGRPTLLWLHTYRGNVPFDSSYSISRDTGTAWQRSGFTFPAGDSTYYARNDHGKLFVLDGELYFTVRMTQIMDLSVMRVTGSSTVDVFSTSATDLRAYDYAFDYELAKSPDGTLHLAYADASDVYSDVAPGLVNYYRKTGDNDAVQIWVDGSPPIGTGPAGLGGMSMTLDASGTPFLSYAAKATGSLRIARSAGMSWVMQDLATGSLVGDSVLRFDTGGRLHVAFEDLEYGSIAVIDEQCP